MSDFVLAWHFSSLKKWMFVEERQEKNPRKKEEEIRKRGFIFTSLFSVAQYVSLQMNRSAATVWWLCGWCPAVVYFLLIHSTTGQLGSTHNRRRGIRGDSLKVTCWAWPGIKTHLIYRHSVLFVFLLFSLFCVSNFASFNLLVIFTLHHL